MIQYVTFWSSWTLVRKRQKPFSRNIANFILLCSPWFMDQGIWNSLGPKLFQAGNIQKPVVPWALAGRQSWQLTSTTLWQLGGLHIFTLEKGETAMPYYLGQFFRICWMKVNFGLVWTSVILLWFVRSLGNVRKTIEDIMNSLRATIKQLFSPCSSNCRLRVTACPGLQPYRQGDTNVTYVTWNSIPHLSTLVQYTQLQWAIM